MEYREYVFYAFIGDNVATIKITNAAITILINGRIPGIEQFQTINLFEISYITCNKF